MKKKTNVMPATPSRTIPLMSLPMINTTMQAHRGRKPPNDVRAKTSAHYFREHCRMNVEALRSATEEQLDAYVREHWVSVPADLKHEMEKLALHEKTCVEEAFNKLSRWEEELDRLNEMKNKTYRSRRTNLIK